ncbi:MAG: hypothetical protein EHM59_00980 [Betaproteobacteria bacterium]|nr:MAG: hypothetical protein EHM59_00980 [Betaproteobacteria bacterium]
MARVASVPSRHLATELFAFAPKVELLHVPYRGVGLALPDQRSQHQVAVMPRRTQ